MTKDITTTPPTPMQQGEIILYQPDETVRLEVRLEDDTVWLNQAQMGELFGTNRQAITKHLQNIYDCEELKKESTSSILELVRREGNRNLSQQLQLDLQRHNQQYAPITVNICQLNHDRFLLVDDEVYLFGASLKDAGKKLFAYIKMQAISAAELLNGIR